MKRVKLTPACATTETICIYKEKKRCEADCVGLRLSVHMIYCKFGNFGEGLIFAKLRICEVS